MLLTSASISSGAVNAATPRADARTWALLVAVGLAFADASVVALALPDLYTELETSIIGASWVLTIYAAVAAVVGMVSAPVTTRLGAGRTTTLGLVLFAGASIACAAAVSLPVLLVARAAQAVGAAALLEGSLGVLAVGPGGFTAARRWWMTASMVGAVVGPALGGVVTQLTDWRTVFLVQAPIVLVAIPAALRSRAAAEPPWSEAAESSWPSGLDAAEWPASGAVPSSESGPSLEDSSTAAGPSRVSLWADSGIAATFAGLVGALFLVVILLVVVWGMEPLGGAAVVATLPLGTLAGRTLAERTDPRLSVVTGALLLASGLLTLALIPDLSVAWVALGLLACGGGFGVLSTVLGPLALPATADLNTAAARTSTARHLGLVVGLVIVAPLVASGVEAGAERATMNGAAVVLDARTDLVQKVRVAWDVRTLILEAEAAEVPDLGPVFAQYGDGDDVRTLESDLDTAIKASITRGFRAAFAAGALLSLLAVVPGWIAVTARSGGSGLAMGSAAVGGAARVAIVTTVIAILVPAVAWSRDARDFGAYTPVDACEAGPDPFSGGGLDGLAQRALLSGLNGAACELGATREELVFSLDPNSRVSDRKWDDETITRALKAGARRAIDDADDRGSLPGLIASALRFAVDRAPLGQLIEWLT